MARVVGPMIAFPGSAVDAADALDVAAVGARPIADALLESTVPRLREWGGDPARYRVALSRGQHAMGTALDLEDPEAIRSLAVVAGWRAGVLDLRNDAITRAASLPEPVTAAALGLAVERLAGFLVAQGSDPFAWPDQEPGTVIARIGGFRGLGGRWIAPPRDPAPIGIGRFRVICGDATWVIRADVFGSSIVPADEEQATSPAVSGGGVDAVVTTSYLVDLVRRA
ncbi:MAG: hypothetical protein ABJA11_00700 [Pseudolysinimonas sp.]